jgi:MinD-like ATPase involved in chromosome partitioning or flagellar assembly
MQLFLLGDSDFCSAFEQALASAGFTVRTYSTVEDVYINIDRESPDAILIQSNNTLKGIASEIAKARPNIKVFVSGPINLDDWEMFTSIGVTNVSGDVRKAVNAIKKILKETEEKVRKEENKSAANSKIVAVYSAKGGVGKTTVATNLAAALGLWSKDKGLKTALLDFNIDGSTGTYVFGIQNPKTVMLWQDIKIPAAWEDVSSSMNYNEKSNVWHLAPPASYEKTQFTGALANKILTLAKEHFDFVIIDMGVALENRDCAIQALSFCNDVLYVTAFDPDTVRLLAQIYKDEICYILDDVSKMSLVVNGVHKTWFKIDDIVSYFNEKAKTAIPVKGVITQDNMIEQYKGKGAPLYCFKPDVQFSQDIKDLIKNLYNIDLKNKKKGFFSRLFGKKG